MNPPPNSEQLMKRIRVIFGVEQAESDVEHINERYVKADTIEEFVIPISGAEKQLGDPEEAAEFWLTTPNPVFGGQSPRAFIEGTPKQRSFLASVLSSIEDGAFS